MYRYADAVDVDELDPSESLATRCSTPAGAGGVVNVNESGVTLLIAMA
jgi:hypothetical protein